MSAALCAKAGAGCAFTKGITPVCKNHNDALGAVWYDAADLKEIGMNANRAGHMIFTGDKDCVLTIYDCPGFRCEKRVIEKRHWHGESCRHIGHMAHRIDSLTISKGNCRVDFFDN